MYYMDKDKVLQGTIKTLGMEVGMAVREAVRAGATEAAREGFRGGDPDEVQKKIDKIIERGVLITATLARLGCGAGV